MRFIFTAILFTSLSLAGCNSLQSFYPSMTKDEQRVEQDKMSKLVQPVVQTPLQQLYHLQPELATELNQVSVQQVFNRVESPTAAQVTVIQSGLMDDSVNAIRTVYQFKRQDTGHWALQQTMISYKCQRGDNKKSFQTQPCA